MIESEAGVCIKWRRRVEISSSAPLPKLLTSFSIWVTLVTSPHEHSLEMVEKYAIHDGCIDSDS